jgi:hypothetical protein
MNHRQLVTPARSNKHKRFVALARVSSREQEREGFSLDVQVEALERYAERNNGVIVKMYRIALESQYEIPFISVSQPTDQTPAGRMQRRVLASMASFYTEQQSLDVREGLARRVQAGLFVGMAPYGYRNVRRDGRSIVEVDEGRANNIRYVFDLYAHHNCTFDTLGERLLREGVKYSDAQPTWPRSKIAKILRDRAYIGDIFYRGQWHPGGHPALIDRVVWDRVQVLLGATSRTRVKSTCITDARDITRGGTRASGSMNQSSTNRSCRCWRASNSPTRSVSGSLTCCACGSRTSSSSRAQAPTTFSAS